MLPKTALNGPVPCVPSPLAQACGGEDILYIFFLIFPGHLEFWIPLQIPSWGPPLGCPCVISSNIFSASHRRLCFRDRSHGHMRLPHALQHMTLLCIYSMRFVSVFSCLLHNFSSTSSMHYLPSSVVNLPSVPSGSFVSDAAVSASVC